MQKPKVLFFVLLFLGALALSLAQSGCSSTPASPAAGPTPTPTVDIVWAYPSISSAGGVQDAFVQLRVNGSAVTNAAVTLSGTFSGSPVAMPFSSYVTHGSTQYASYENTTFTYQLGAVYTLSTTAMGKTASSSVTAPGGISLLVDAANGNAVTYVSWTNEGALDHVYIYENSPTGGYTYDTAASTTNINSPLSLPDSGGGSLYPGGSGSDYSFDAIIRNESAATLNGSVTLSANLYAEEYAYRVITLP